MGSTHKYVRPVTVAINVELNNPEPLMVNLVSIPVKDFNNEGNQAMATRMFVKTMMAKRKINANNR